MSDALLLAVEVNGADGGLRLWQATSGGHGERWLASGWGQYDDHREDQRQGGHEWNAEQRERLHSPGPSALLTCQRSRSLVRVRE